MVRNKPQPGIKTDHLTGHEPQNGPKTHSSDTRGIDPNVIQRKASDPDYSIWVNASAGTGKTKVLTDRVLRLMLPRQDGQPGTPARKILGITFTKAGASEMTLRISKALAEWAVMPEDKLVTALKDLLDRTPTANDILSARRLFADVVDTPGGLKIMTIHAFCQSVLSRFPLEARLPPYFTGLDESQAKELLNRAQAEMFKQAEAEKSSPRGQALRHVAEIISQDQFSEFMKSIASERRQLRELKERFFNADGLYTAICAALSIPAGKSQQEILEAHCQDSAFAKDDLQNAMHVLLRSKSKTDNQKGEILARWLSETPRARTSIYEEYRQIFLTTEMEISKKLATKEAGNEVIEALSREAERLIGVNDILNTAQCAAFTRDLFILGLEVSEIYQKIKNEKAALDYDDLIITTLDLLEGRTNALGQNLAASWVLFKLDQGFDHILIDEAQDTNPEQWQIIDALCTDFFAGRGAAEHVRTVFTVGDKKQSIYSFQRASPEEFARMQQDFSAKIKAAAGKWDVVPMNISFRSAQSILRTVDATFAQPEMRQGLSQAEIIHDSYRTRTYGQAGHVELWPLCETMRARDEEGWQLPLFPVESQSGAADLARKIAEKISHWIENKEELLSQGRPITPGDIMILVRTRTSFFEQLARELKRKNIPVSGVDRMKLGEQLAVQDLMAAAEFALLPADDLSLAAFLKSPLIGLDEDKLFSLAFNRKGTLWDAVKSGADENIRNYLQNLIEKAGKILPYEFFSMILNAPCPADEKGGLRAIKKRLGEDSLDPLDEFLNAALQYETANIPNLQSFLHAQAQSQTEIKRELSEHGNAVRIMTVHGSKGLQAPIVILPDTIRTSTQVPNQISRRLLWPDKSGLNFPLCSPRKESDFNLYAQTYQNVSLRADEEYKRLLYVAMTRAEDRLYICGHKGVKSPIQTSWYNFMKAGLESLPETEAAEDGTLILKNPQTREPERKKEKRKPDARLVDTPGWIFKMAMPEAPLQAPLTPSRALEDTQAAASPLQESDTYRFRRGNLTHKLLQLLPALPQDRRRPGAESYLKRFAPDVPQDIQADILREIFKLLDDPAFSAVFAPEALAEVPLSGLTPDGRAISGQIDRLLITEKRILVIDYKTNRPPPVRAEDVPALYIRQMQAYADILKGIYPGRAIETALLWTDGPILMPIPVS
jgi:ATP-dependent helicase/nuclease subunit A